MTVTPIWRLRTIRSAGYRCEVRSLAGVRCNARAADTAEQDGGLVAACTEHRD